MRVRLTHALGSNEFELAARGVDDPVVLGRSSDADLQVPSIEVSRTHAVMFVHEGAWVVQDSGSRDGTSVNGVKIDGPTRVNVGDRVTLGAGPKAATVQVMSLAEAPPPVPASVPVEPEVGALEASIPTVPYVRRYPRKNNANNIAVFAISGAVLIGVGFFGAIWAYIAYMNKVKANEAIEAQNAAKAREVVVTKSESQKKTIFMDGSKVAVPAPTAVENVPPPVVPGPVSTTPPVPTPPVPTPPAPTPTAPEAPPEAPQAPTDPAWQRVVEFHDSSPPALAIYQYIQYRATEPAPDKLAKLDAFQDEAIDLLWWQRINDLVDQQTQITGQISELKKEKASLTDATKDRREQFDKQIKHLESLYASNKLLLQDEMGFKADKPVDLADEATLKTLRQERNADAYTRWTGRVLSRVKATRGASAW